MPETYPLAVLIIEDDADTRGNLQDILELDGYEVELAGSIAESLKNRDWSKLFAIVLDRQLPDGRAEDLLPRLRERAPEAAVIIVTGHADLEGAVAAVRLGAADYILKPIDPEFLRSRLGRLAEHRRIRAELHLAQEKMLSSERLAAIGEMMAGLAHESRNALQRSQACLEMLALEVQDRPAALNLVARIQKAQDRLHFLHEEVRSYAAPLTIRCQPVDLRNVVLEAWEHLSILRQSRQADLQLDSGNSDCRCEVDSAYMEQVVLNILQNSLSACADPVKLTARFRDVSLDAVPALQLALSDNGPGLSAEQRERLFEPFFTTKTHGTGLGMAIAQRIVEAHGGTIAVGDDQNPGAEIVMTLPRHAC